MKFFIVLLCALIVVSCAPPIQVSQFHLRNAKTASTPVQMVKAEASYRFDHNLEKSDRDQRHGHYYVVRWSNRALLDKNLPLTIKLSYLQADQGREPRIMQQTVSPRDTSKVEFHVIGDHYAKSGRILAWKAEIIQQGQSLASEQSFLWE